MTRRKRVLIVTPNGNPPGGGGTVTAWMLQGLCAEHDVTVLSASPLRFDAINRYYGTTLSSADVGSVVAPPPGDRFLPKHRLSFWKYCRLLQVSRRIVADYDVPIGTFSEADFGRRGIQYIHYPLLRDPRFNASFKEPLPTAHLRWYHRSYTVMGAYFRLSSIGSGLSKSRVRDNMTLANSEWTGAKFKEVYGVDPITLYPPVPTDFPAVPWQDREHGFVCLVRFFHDKRIEAIIAILAAVRERGHNVHLRIIGSTGDRRYERSIRRLQQRHGAWVSVEVDLTRTQVADRLAHHRFGLHAKHQEHFGIAVAEMVRAGCIPFVSHDGGTEEIVGYHPSLIYRTDDEAVETICAVLRDKDLVQPLRQHLNGARERFSTKAFMDGMRRHVAEFTA